jgi:Uncharacterized ACR, COG1993
VSFAISKNSDASFRAWLCVELHPPEDAEVDACLDMLTRGPAKRVTVYTTEGETHHHQPVYLAVLHYLFYHGVSGATVTRGVAG